MGLCLVPGLITLAWTQHAAPGPPGQQIMVALSGTGLRLVLVLGAGLTLYVGVAYYQNLNFWVWLLVFYLFTLGWEVVLLVAGRGTAGAG
jgi:hypothetical protein